MRYLLWILLLISLGLNVGLLVRSQDAPEGKPWRHDLVPPEGGHGPGPGFGGDGRRFTGLDLTETQHDRLMEMRGRWREDLGPLRAEMRSGFEEMRDLLREEDIDRERVAGARRRLAAIRAEVDSLVADHLLEELELLTPEQRERYLERMPWNRMGGGGRGRGPR